MIQKRGKRPAYYNLITALPMTITLILVYGCQFTVCLLSFVILVPQLRLLFICLPAWQTSSAPGLDATAMVWRKA
jgi:hypothetical protein